MTSASWKRTGQRQLSILGGQYRLSVLCVDLAHDDRCYWLLNYHLTWARDLVTSTWPRRVTVHCRFIVLGRRRPPAVFWTYGQWVHAQAGYADQLRFSLHSAHALRFIKTIRWSNKYNGDAEWIRLSGQLTGFNYQLRITEIRLQNSRILDLWYCSMKSVAVYSSYRMMLSAWCEHISFLALLSFCPP